jgi:heme/copper-type cytochrome/quinol oxidase subunit 3
MLEPKTNHRTPPGAGTLGMWLFLAALTMLFASSLLGYIFIRTNSAQSPPSGTLHFPPALWLSTAVILLGSYTIHQALAAVRRERQKQFRAYLLITCVIAAAFVIVQTPSLAALLVQHQRFRERSLQLYGLVFFLILVHALHVLGGIIGLAITTIQAHRHRYDHEHYAGVKHAAMYWHFLDGVWLVLFLGMFLLG